MSNLKISNLDVARAWKDEDYRLSLSDEERALLPDNPVGMVELSDAELRDVHGGTTGLFCAAVTNFLPGPGGLPNSYPAGSCEQPIA